MKHLIIIPFLIISVICSHAGEFKESPIVNREIMNAIIRTAKKGLSIKLTDAGDSGGGASFRASLEKFLTVECDESDRIKFMLAFRAATQKRFLDHGVTIHSWGKRGTDEDLRGFSWEYGWFENNGIMTVRFVPTADGKGELTVFCYEHLRGVPAPPRAKGY